MNKMTTKRDKTMKLLKNQGWKCISTDFTSHGHKWKLNKWFEVKGDLKLCSNGFHASKTILDAWNYVNPGWICLVEYDGKVIEDNDKFVAQRMRIIKRYEWCKKDSLNFSLFCVKRSMKYFDRKKFPEVWKVCLGSIKVIDAVLLKDTKKNRDAAWSAESAAWSAAWSAESAAKSAAWSAAWSAARSAESAAWSAESAAKSAAKSAAWSAARSAESAAWSAAKSAAWSAESKLQEKWLQKYLKNKEN